MPRIRVSKQLYETLAKEAKYRGMSLEEFLLWLYYRAPKLAEGVRIRIPKDLYGRLGKHKARTGLCVAEMIEQAIQWFLWKFS